MVKISQVFVYSFSFFILIMYYSSFFYHL